MGTIVEDVLAQADWVANALSQTGYKADFSPVSLWEIDRFFDDNSRNGQAVPGGLLSDQLGPRLFSLGAYVGEVIRRNRGGEWIGDDKDPQAEINVQLHLPDGTTCWPVQRIMKRFKNGPLDGIAGYGAGAGLNVGSPPKKNKGHTFRIKSKPWWKFW